MTRHQAATITVTILAAVGAGTLLAPVCYAGTTAADALRRAFRSLDLSDPFDFEPWEGE